MTAEPSRGPGDRAGAKPLNRRLARSRGQGGPDHNLGMLMKILLADDDESVRDSLQKVLEGAGYDVVAAADGRQAVRLFNQETVDLLVLDLGLPNWSGWEVFELVTSRFPLLPVIIITGQTDQFKTAAAAGAGALMEKPLDAPLLLDTIAQLLAEKPESRLLRRCGYVNSTRHIISHSARMARDLDERCTHPLHTQLVDKLHLHRPGAM